MRHPVSHAMLAMSLLVLVEFAISQQTGDQDIPQHPATYQNITPEQRAAATREFLGLGPEPDKAAAGRGARPDPA